jgi:hypothetical protein
MYVTSELGLMIVDYHITYSPVLKAAYFSAQFLFLFKNILELTDFTIFPLNAACGLLDYDMYTMGRACSSEMLVST